MTAPPEGLQHLVELTAAITRAQEKVGALAEQRKRYIYRLDAEGVPRRAMADALGVTIQTIYRIAPATGPQP